MKKTTNTIILISAFIFSYAQVGINTTNPLGLFHIDGSKNSSTPIPSQLIFTKQGYLGIGTTEPSYNLQVMGTIAFPSLPKNYVVGPYNALGINTNTGNIGVFTPGSSPVSIRTSKTTKALGVSPSVLPIISDSSSESLINTAGIIYNDVDNYIQFTQDGIYRIDINIFAQCVKDANGTGLNIIYQLAKSNTLNFTDLNESRIVILNYDSVSYPGFSSYVKSFSQGERIKLTMYRSIGTGSSCQISLPTKADFSNQIIITKL